MRPDMAEDLLQAADQYMLEALKRLCEASISSSLSAESLANTYALAENFNAPQLARRCILHALEHYEAALLALGTSTFASLIEQMVPKLKEFVIEQLVKTAVKV